MTMLNKTVKSRDPTTFSLNHSIFYLEKCSDKEGRNLDLKHDFPWSNDYTKLDQDLK